MKLLYINACVRAESRTKRLADKLLQKLNETYDEVCLKEIQFPVVDESFLHERERLASEEECMNPMIKLAKQFAEAEDLSFPAALKQYLEQINVVGITFKYTEEGVPVGLCKAKRLFVVSTAGGFFAPEEYGFGYIKALAENYYGIKDVRHIRALGLDIVGADEEKILSDAEKEIMLLDS